MIDLHHHILPGVDDGPATIEEAVAMGRQAAADGIEILVATPHMLSGFFAVTASQVRDGVRVLNDALRRAWAEGGEAIDAPSPSSTADPHPIRPRDAAFPSRVTRHGPPSILPGADVHLHEDLVEKIRAGEVLTINETGKYLLLELPMTVLPSRLGNFLFRLLSTGVRPLLTHPERHPGIAGRPNELAEWVERGGLVQVTAASYLGRFGPDVQAVSERWTVEGLVHVVASDAHPLPGRMGGLPEAAARLADLVGPIAARRIVEENPERIIRGEGI
jgi:protein-tyrosine phosphatase